MLWLRIQLAGLTVLVQRTITSLCVAARAKVLNATETHYLLQSKSRKIMKTFKSMLSMVIIIFSDLLLFSNAAMAVEKGGTKVTPKPDLVSVPLRSEMDNISWPSSLGRQYSDVVKSLAGEKLRVKAVGSGPQGILVIYNDKGKCILCLGKSSACTEACGVGKISKEETSPLLD